MRRSVGSPRLAWTARVALLALVGCVPDTFVFEQGGQSASGAGGFGGSGGVGGGSGGQGGSTGSAIPVEPKCGDGLVNADEECDPLNPIDDQVFEDELSDALPEPLDLGCTHDCRRIVTWHQDLAVPGGRPVAIAESLFSAPLILAGNAPAPSRRFFVEMDMAEGALEELRVEGPGTFVHDLVSDGQNHFLLASDDVDTASPSTFIADDYHLQVRAPLVFDFDQETVARYGRAGSLFTLLHGIQELPRFYALGSAAGGARPQRIDLDLDYSVTDLSVQTSLVGAGPGALFAELGEGDPVTVAWGDTLVRLKPPERSAKVALPDAMINGSCPLSDTSGLVVGDYDAGGVRAMFAATYVDDGVQLTLTPLEVPYTAPSRAVGLACHSSEGFAVGEADGGAFTLRWSGGQWRERRVHRGPGGRPAAATTVRIDRRTNNGLWVRAIFVAGWHETAAGEFPWVRRYTF